MDIRDLHVDEWVVVAGRGPMKVEALPVSPAKTTVTLRTAYGFTITVRPADLCGRVDAEYLAHYLPSYRSRLGEPPAALVALEAELLG